MRSVALIALASLGMSGCGSATHLVVELIADSETPPVDRVLLNVSDDDGVTLFSEPLAVSPAKPLPITVVLEPSDDIPETLSLEVAVFADDQPIAEGGGSGRFVRGAINELTLDLQAVF
ncbi:MAG: hypothetical protein AAFU77_08925 [Myxococcota bacterium]